MNHIFTCWTGATSKGSREIYTRDWWVSGTHWSVTLTLVNIHYTSWVSGWRSPTIVTDTRVLRL